MALHQRSAQLAFSLIVWITLGSILNLVTLLFTQSTSAQILIAQVSLPPNIRQFLEDFDLTPVHCNGGVASILLGENTVCVQPSARIPIGAYVYDAATDQIKPLHNSPTNSSPVQPNSGGSSSNQTTVTQPGYQSSYQFSFTNSFDYSNCLEDIIQLYKSQSFTQTRRSSCLPEIFQAANRPLTQAQTLDLIRAADAYATSTLSPAIYPPRGLRSRIAQEFGYTYSLDTNR